MKRLINIIYLFVIFSSSICLAEGNLTTEANDIKWQAPEIITGAGSFIGFPSAHFTPNIKNKYFNPKYGHSLTETFNKVTIPLRSENIRLAVGNASGKSNYNYANSDGSGWFSMNPWSTETKYIEEIETNGNFVEIDYVWIYQIPEIQKKKKENLLFFMPLQKIEYKLGCKAEYINVQEKIIYKYNYGSRSVESGEWGLCGTGMMIALPVERKYFVSDHFAFNLGAHLYKINVPLRGTINGKEVLNNIDGSGAGFNGGLTIRF